MFDWLRKLFGINPKPKILEGDERFGFTAMVDGDDIVVKNAVATWFGGDDDPEDNGETASGVSTKARPNIQGCALPMNFGPCAGSPIPKLPWGTKVEVTHEGKTITVPVIDLGPARGTRDSSFRVCGRLVKNRRRWGTLGRGQSRPPVFLPATDSDPAARQAGVGVCDW